MKFTLTGTKSFPTVEVFAYKLTGWLLGLFNIAIGVAIMLRPNAGVSSSAVLLRIIDSVLPTLNAANNTIHVGLLFLAVGFLALFIHNFVARHALLVPYALLVLSVWFRVFENPDIAFTLPIVYSSVFPVLLALVWIPYIVKLIVEDHDNASK